MHQQAVCWQPTAVDCSPVGYKEQVVGRVKASGGCMLATYSTWKFQGSK